MKRNLSILVTVGLFAGLLIGGEAFATHLAEVTDIQTAETATIPSNSLEIGELNINPHCHAFCDSIFGHSDPGGALGHGEGFFLVNSPTPFHDAGDFTSGTLIGLSIDAPTVLTLGGDITVPFLLDPLNDIFQFDIFNTALPDTGLAISLLSDDGAARAQVSSVPSLRGFLLYDEEFGGGVCTGSGCPETLVLDCQAGSCPEQGFTYTCVGACPETIDFACESGDCSDILSVSCAGDACASTLDVSCDGGACFTGIGLSCAGGVCPDEVSLTCTEGGCSEAQSLDLDISCAGGVCPDEVSLTCTAGGCSEDQSIDLDISCAGGVCPDEVSLTCGAGGCPDDVDVTCEAGSCSAGPVPACTGSECDAYADETVVEWTWPFPEEGEPVPVVAFSFHAEGGMNQGTVVLADRGNIDSIIDELSGGHALAIPGSDPDYRALAVKYSPDEVAELAFATSLLVSENPAAAAAAVARFRHARERETEALNSFEQTDEGHRLNQDRQEKYEAVRDAVVRGDSREVIDEAAAAFHQADEARNQAFEDFAPGVHEEVVNAFIDFDEIETAEPEKAADVEAPAERPSLSSATQAADVEVIDSDVDSVVDDLCGIVVLC